MKKIKLVMICVALCCFVNTMNAQGFHIGVKGGINLSNASIDENSLKSENRAGFFVGPSILIDLPATGLGVDLSALYNQKDNKVGGETVKQKSLDVPVNLRYSFNFTDAATIFAFAGPQIAFNLGDKDIDLDTVDWNFKQTNFSFNVGAGFSVSKLQLSLSYNIPLGKTADVTWSYGSNEVLHAHTKSWQIAAAVYF